MLLLFIFVKLEGFKEYTFVAGDFNKNFRNNYILFQYSKEDSEYKYVKNQVSSNQVFTMLITYKYL